MNWARPGIKTIVYHYDSRLHSTTLKLDISITYDLVKIEKSEDSHSQGDTYTLLDLSQQANTHCRFKPG